MIADVCSGFSDSFFSSIALLCALASLATVLLIAISYMVGQFFSNPKITLWAKTEILQLFFSIVSVFIIIAFIQSFCLFDVSDVSSLIMEQSTSTKNVFEGAESYLVQSGIYIHKSMNIQQYYLMSYQMLLLRSRYDCIFGSILCIFGNSGIFSSPYAWASLSSGTITASYNATVIAYMTNLVFLLLLKYSTSGFIMFFLPLGILIRSLPYLRSLGSLFITISFCFLIIYPTILSIFYIISLQDISPIPTAIKDYDPDDVVDAGNAASVFASSWDAFDDHYSSEFFDSDRHETDLFKIAGTSFVIGIFFPTLALLATITSISYIGRLLGEEIDLSRIIRMV